MRSFARSAAAALAAAACIGPRLRRYAPTAALAAAACIGPRPAEPPFVVVEDAHTRVYAADVESTAAALRAVALEAGYTLEPPDVASGPEAGALRARSPVETRFFTLSGELSRQHVLAASIAPVPNLSRARVRLDAELVSGPAGAAPVESQAVRDGEWYAGWFARLEAKLAAE